MKRAFYFILFLICYCNVNAFEKVTYPFVNEPIDVMIPAVAKDIDTLNLCIEGIRENCKQVRRIIVVSDKRLTTKAEWFDEKRFPFDKKVIAKYLFGDGPYATRKNLKKPHPRMGWFLQSQMQHR